MKRKNGYVIWLNYFDSKLSRKRGRRLSHREAIKKPSLEELKQVAEEAGYKVLEIKEGRYPPSWWIKTGYIVIQKPGDQSKTEVIKTLAYLIRRRRGGG